MQLPSVLKYFGAMHHVQVSTEDKHCLQSKLVQERQVFVALSG